MSDSDEHNNPYDELVEWVNQIHFDIDPERKQQQIQTLLRGQDVDTIDEVLEIDDLQKFCLTNGLTQGIYGPLQRHVNALRTTRMFAIRRYSEETIPKQVVKRASPDPSPPVTRTTTAPLKVKAPPKDPNARAPNTPRYGCKKVEKEGALELLKQIREAEQFNRDFPAAAKSLSEDDANTKEGIKKIIKVREQLTQYNRERAANIANRTGAQSAQSQVELQEAKQWVEKNIHWWVAKNIHSNSETGKRLKEDDCAKYSRILGIPQSDNQNDRILKLLLWKGGHGKIDRENVIIYC